MTQIALCSCQKNPTRADLVKSTTTTTVLKLERINLLLHTLHVLVQHVVVWHYTHAHCPDPPTVPYFAETWDMAIQLAHHHYNHVHLSVSIASENVLPQEILQSSYV